MSSRFEASRSVEAIECDRISPPTIGERDTRHPRRWLTGTTLKTKCLLTAAGTGTALPTEKLAARMSTLFARLLGSPLTCSGDIAPAHCRACQARRVLPRQGEGRARQRRFPADIVMGEDASALGSLLDAALLAFDVELFSALFTDWKVGTQPMPLATVDIAPRCACHQERVEEQQQLSKTAEFAQARRHCPRVVSTPPFEHFVLWASFLCVYCPAGRRPELQPKSTRTLSWRTARVLSTIADALVEQHADVADGARGKCEPRPAKSAGANFTRRRRPCIPHDRSSFSLLLSQDVELTMSDELSRHGLLSDREIHRAAWSSSRKATSRPGISIRAARSWTLHCHQRVSSRTVLPVRARGRHRLQLLQQLLPSLVLRPRDWLVPSRPGPGWAGAHT